MGARDRTIHLLLSLADERSPALPAGAPAEVGLAGAGDAAEAGASEGSGGRWGVFAPIGGAGDAALAALAPLLAHRAEEQGRPAAVVRAPAGADAASVAERLDTEDPEDRISDLLIVGDLDAVSEATAAALGRGRRVGRLALAAADAYAAYAAKVVGWERAPALPGRAAALFHTVHDGSAATAAGYRGAMAPALRWAREARLRGALALQPIELGDPDEPAPDDLLEGAEAVGGALITLSHGDGAPRSGWRGAGERRRGQGALSFGRAGRLRGGDLAGRRFMPGGIWWLEASFGAGTGAPGRDARRVAALAEAGLVSEAAALGRSLLAGDERPFVAALPRAALACPEGPVAVIGRVDLAWSFDHNATAAAFVALVGALSGGARAGEALGRAGAAARGGGGGGLGGVILLGDPAARLPRRELGEARPGAPVAAEAGIGRGHAVPRGTDAAAVEAAIWALLASDDEAAHAHAARLGVDRAALGALCDAYAAAGRRAIAALLAGDGGEGADL